ncbi:MAG: hypothetical protein HYX39_02095, partial [Bacteroidetes bacterium]|nr:hypothetical protein [Bacteroidota bacterium]
MPRGITNGRIHNFIAKYNAAGVIKWIKKTGTGNSTYWGLGFKTDASGNSYLGGSFVTREIFGTYTVNAYGGAYSEEAYLAKIDSSGNWLWATHIGNSVGTQAGLYDLALDKSGNPYICGFSGYTSTKFDNIIVPNTGEDDWFLAKYNTSGNCIWAKGGGGPGSQEATAVCVDNNNEVYIARTGTFFSKFDGAGNYMWSHFKPGTLNRAMINDGQGGIYFTGTHNVNVSFDSFTLNTSNGDYRSYIARLSNPNIATGLKDL